jgi:hypothetical protein
MHGAALCWAAGVIPVHAFIRKFVRENDGVWMCVEAGELDLPAGRIQVAVGTRFTRGTRFMGVDLALLLDEYYAQHKPRF